MVAAPVEVDVRLPAAVEVTTTVLPALEVVTGALGEAELAREVTVVTAVELLARLVEETMIEETVLEVLTVAALLLTVARDEDEEPDCAATRPAMRGNRMVWAFMVI